MILLVPFRNRDTRRLMLGLRSLDKQTYRQFSVKVIDYGSDPPTAEALQKITYPFEFCEYVRVEAAGQLWNKSKALNTALKPLTDGTVFIADADLLYAPDFVEKAKKLVQPSAAMYFKVGFLSEKASRTEKQFADYDIKFLSAEGATGLTLFPVKALREVGGFDEFFHFWGAEDTDIHNRLKMAGFEVKFYDKEVLLLHQWHPIYRSGREGVLTAEPRLSNAVRLNHEHLRYNLRNQIIRPNGAHWGQMPDPKVVAALQQAPVHTTLTNRKEEIDHFLTVEWPRHKDLLSVSIVQDPFYNSLKYHLKKMLGKSVPSYYSLKEVNDKLLLLIISRFRDYPYIYRVEVDKKCIYLKMKFPS